MSLLLSSSSSIAWQLSLTQMRAFDDACEEIANLTDADAFFDWSAIPALRFAVETIGLVRAVMDYRNSGMSERAAIRAAADDLGMSADTLTSKIQAVRRRVKNSLTGDGPVQSSR